MNNILLKQINIAQIVEVNIFEKKKVIQKKTNIRSQLNIIKD